MSSEIVLNRASMVLTVLLLFLWTLLIYLLVKLLRQRYGLYPGRIRESPIPPRRLERRYQTIEHWIITKKVIPHDHFCAKCRSLDLQRSDGGKQHHPQHPQQLLQHLDPPKSSQQSTTNIISGCSHARTGVATSAGTEGGIETVATANTETLSSPPSNGNSSPGEERSQLSCYDVRTPEVDHRDQEATSSRETDVDGDNDGNSIVLSRRTDTLKQDSVISTHTTGTSISDAISDATIDTQEQQENAPSATDENGPQASNSLTGSIVHNHTNCGTDECGRPLDVEMGCCHSEHENVHCEDDIDGPMPAIPEPSPNQCAICLGTFRVGSIVSWAVNEKCSHVFHHECIKEWLLRRSGCPVCRRTMLLVDRYSREDHDGYYAYTHVTNALRIGNRRAKPEQLQKWSQQYVTRASVTYCCMDHGLVSVPQTMICTRRDLQHLSDRIIGCVVQPNELQKIRGHRQDATTTVADFDPIHPHHQQQQHQPFHNVQSEQEEQKSLQEQHPANLQQQTYNDAAYVFDGRVSSDETIAEAAAAEPATIETVNPPFVSQAGTQNNNSLPNEIEV